MSEANKAAAEATGCMVKFLRAEIGSTLRIGFSAMGVKLSLRIERRNGERLHPGSRLDADSTERTMRTMPPTVNSRSREARRLTITLPLWLLVHLLIGSGLPRRADGEIRPATVDTDEEFENKQTRCSPAMNSSCTRERIQKPPL
jgi:hypothetical protein